MSFERIKKNVVKGYQKREKQHKQLLVKGFLKEWGESNTNDKKNVINKTLREDLTTAKYNAFVNKKLSLKDAQKLAFERYQQQQQKKLQADLKHIDEIANTEKANYIKISITWHKSPTWGYNPAGECWAGGNYTTGSASGCGYDKKSACMAECLNANNSILYILYEMEEKRLSKRNPETRRDFIGYGSGYGAKPYFEGGVGDSCHISILKKAGFEVTEGHGSSYDFYEFRLCKKRKQSK